MTNKIKVHKGTLTVEIDLVMYKEGKYFVAYLPSLNLTSHSTDEKKALKGVDDALELFFQEWEGKLHEKLISLGWIKKNHQLRPTNTNSVPYFLLQNKTNVHLSKKPIQVPAEC